jgi:hypothetical protein
MARRIPKASGGGAAGNELPIGYVHQEKNNWCWCACAKMVLQHFGNAGIEKCEIADIAFKRNDCCSGDHCNLSLPMKDAPNSIVGLYGDCGILVDHIDGALSYEQVTAEIDNKRPVEASLLREDGGEHVVIVYGWRKVDGRDKVLVHDPWRGVAVIEHERLASAYGEGKWSSTLVNFRKAL